MAFLTAKLGNRRAPVHHGTHEFGLIQPGRKGADERRNDSERERGETKKKSRSLPVAERTRPGALCEGRKKGRAIYKASQHRNWASLRQTLEDQDVSLRGTEEGGGVEGVVWSRVNGARLCE